MVKLILATDIKMEINLAVVSNASRETNTIGINTFLIILSSKYPALVLKQENEIPCPFKEKFLTP